jgi:hypothetical protein
MTSKKSKQDALIDELLQDCDNPAKIGYVKIWDYVLRIVWKTLARGDRLRTP